MAGVPQAPVVVPVFLGNDVQFRGNSRIHMPTKSQLTLPVFYRSPDQCGNNLYIKGQVSVNVNYRDEDCNIVQNAAGSINVLLPIGATAADISAIVDFLQAQLITGLADLPPIGD